MKRDEKEERIQRYLAEIMNRNKSERNSSVISYNIDHDAHSHYPANSPRHSGLEKSSHDSIRRDERESVYRSVMDSMIDIKKQQADDNSIEGILQKFYGLIMRHDSNQEEVDVIISLIRFYQDYIKKMQQDLALKEKDRVFYEQCSKDSLYEVERCKQQAADLRETVDRYEREMSKWTAAATANTGIKELEHKYGQTIGHYKKMIDDLEANYNQSKKNELMAADKLNKMRQEQEKLADAFNAQKSDLMRLEMKEKEYLIEIDRLHHTNRSALMKYDALIKDKSMADDRCRDLERRHSDIEHRLTEIDQLKAANERLKKSAESLIDEVCKYKFRIKELELENQAVRDIRDINQSYKFDDDIKKLSDKFTADYVHQVAASHRSLHTNYHEQHKFEDPVSGEYRRIESANTLKKPEPAFVDAKRVESANANLRAAQNITTFPAHASIERNQAKISDLNKELSVEQDNKKMIEALLCRLPEKPKRTVDRDKKNQLEEDLERCAKKISELKKLIRDMTGF